LMILWRAFFSGGSLSSDLSSKIDFISLVPMQLKRMLENIEQLSILKTIRVILIGGAPLTAPLKLLAKSHELILFETYGMSETTSLLMINGEVLPYREVQLDEQNFFNVRGKTLALGYFQNNQLLFFPATSDSSWLKTNDLGFSDELGILHFQERSDLIFVSGGENINPRLIEEAVKMHPLVTDAYLLAITDEHWGEMGILLYESNNQTNVSVQEINQYLKKELHPYQVPKFIYNTILNFQGQLKPNRSQLKRLAYDLYLKNIFSFEYLEKKQAPLIVFFHGFLGNKDDLKEISLHLRDRYSLLYIDLPGHGETNCKNFYSTDDFFKKFADFIRLFSENFIFYGYSMGGRIALNLSLNYLVPTKLILESAGLGLIDENEQHERKESDYNQFLKIDQANLLGFLRRWYTNPIFKTFSEQTSFNLEIEKKSLHDLKQWQMSQTLFSAGCFPTKNKNIEKLKNVSFELLYIYGENDLKYKNYALELQSIKSMALIQTEKIIGAEHNPYKTHPLETIEVLRKKLK
ncbi:MAG: alpha/beta fold hydrolase, partial [Bacteriovorax sp.]|nr:alpha/beta fold hydrolase [Bacteriovorax sp.]